MAYHLNVMRIAGIVKVIKRRTVRGGTEQYYRIAAAKILYAGPGMPPAGPMLGAVAADLDAADEVPVPQHHALSLDVAKAAQFVTALRELNELAHHSGLTHSATDEPRYGMLLSFYRYRRPDPDDHTQAQAGRPSSR